MMYRVVISSVVFAFCALLSIPEGRAAKLGLLEVKKYGNPTTVEFVRCVGCSIKTLCRNARRFLYFIPLFASAETDSFICVCGIFPTES